MNEHTIPMEMWNHLKLLVQPDDKTAQRKWMRRYFMHYYNQPMQLPRNSVLICA